MNRKALFLALIVSLVSALTAHAQKTEITISLNEQFFDSLVDSIYQNSPPPEFKLSSNRSDSKPATMANSFAASPGCGAITLLRENRSMRTAVRFREGKIYAPVAFSGNYNTPLIGCLDFTGYAETNVDLTFDPASQKLFGSIKVLNVNLDGTAGLGGSIIAKMVQSSIDKKLNPIEIISLDKLSFPFTLPNSTKLKMRATGVRHQVVAGALNIVISYEFVKE